MGSLFFAVQFEFTHAIGPHAGRYVVANPGTTGADGVAPKAPKLTRRQELTGVTMDKGTADVLVVTVLAAPPRRQKIRRKAKEMEMDEEAAEVPLLLATFVHSAEAVTSVKEADRFLLALAESEDEQQVWVADGLAVLNRAIRAYRAASHDPYVTEVAQRNARITRIGYGTTDEVAAGRFTRAAILPPPIGVKPSREERLVPSETTADVLTGRGTVLEGEDVLLRAYADLDHGRLRAAALQARAAIYLIEVELVELGVDLRTIHVDFDDLSARAERIVSTIPVGPLGGDVPDELEKLVAQIARAVESWRYQLMAL